MVNTFAHFTYYPGKILYGCKWREIFLHDPNLQLYNTRSYLGFYIFYQYCHLHYLQFHIPNSAMAWQHQSQKCSPHVRIYNHIHAHLAVFCFVIVWGKSLIQASNTICCATIVPPNHPPPARPPPDCTILYTTPTLCRPPTYPHRQHHHRRFSREEQFHLSWKTSSCYEKQVGK